MTLMSSISFGRVRTDSVILHRMWSYNSLYGKSVEGKEQNVYMKYNFYAQRRNPSLYLIPTMYSIAKGDKNYFGEVYCKMKFRDVSDYDINKQVVCGTIPHNRNVMPTMLQFITPNIYEESIYPDQLLSPFHEANRSFYRYKVMFTFGLMSVIRFLPRTDNTQLVSGTAVVDTNTGRVTSVNFEGNYDLISFKVSTTMNRNPALSVLPEHCKTDAVFRFLGNNIKVSFSAYYDCPTTLPDSITDHEDRSMMEALRPIELNPEEAAIYEQYDQKEESESQDSASVQTSKRNNLLDLTWDVGDNLVNSLHANSGNASVHMSPLLNPLYLSYSKTRGFSYKINIGAKYTWNSHRFLTLNPTLGYNFRQKQIYYTAPIRMTYNPKRDGYAEVTIANGNRITNGSLEDDIQKLLGKEFELPEFNDRYIKAVNNIEVFKGLSVTTGAIFHHRYSTDKELMQSVGMDVVYRSFAPLITFQITPWRQGPILTANYERSFKHIMNSNLSYERMEFDMSYKRQLKSMRAISIRTGTGFYTQRSSDYFVDFTNFQDDNLPSGWEDEWKGRFQLLNSRWYNESDYYIRGHLCYESPLLALTWIPYIGRALETERLYVSVLSIQNTRPYGELGYGFTNRYFSTGLFVSFLNYKFQGFGCRFTIELFKRW